MPAPLGNRFWEARSSHGPKPKFDDDQTLWAACLEYFDWVDANPLKESKIVSYQGYSKLEEVPKMRAMTINGLCMFIGISQDTWSRYRLNEDLRGVTTRADSVIKEQKFTGAAADLLNPNIIARDLGLKDTSKLVTDDGKGGDAPIQSQIDYSKLSKDALREIIAAAESE